MADFSYIKNDGSTGTVSAANAAAALASAPGIAAHSGVQAIVAPSAPPGSTATGGTPQSTTPPAVGTTPAQAYKGLTIGAADPADAALRDATGIAKTAAYTPIDENAIYQNKLAMYQAEIDATNQIYADQLAKAKTQGISNLGTGRSIQARSGTLGSDFGAAQTDKINEANRATEASIQAEQAAKIGAILGLARQDAAAEIANKRAAQQAGLKDYIDYLGQQTTRRTNNLAKVAAAVLDQGLTVDQIDPSQLDTIAKNYGVTADDIKQAIATETKNRADIKAKADAQAIKDNSFDLSEGQSYYQYDPATGGYKLIASKAKTYAPKSGSGDGSGLDSAGYNGDFEATIALAAQQGGTNQQRATIANNLKSFIANGDYKSAYAQIINSTTMGLKGAASTKFSEQVNSLGVLADLKDAINEYAANGGNTNILKGTEDEIQKKIGVLTTDPQYGALATQLDMAFQAYRQQMTGAAFGAQESAEYAKVLPGKGKTLDLNLATLNGAQNYLNSSVNSSIKSVVGDGGVYIGEYASGASKPAAAPAAEDHTGQVHVRLSTGQTGYVPSSEYDPATMQKI